MLDPHHTHIHLPLFIWLVVPVFDIFKLFSMTIILFCRIPFNVSRSQEAVVRCGRLT